MFSLSFKKSKTGFLDTVRELAHKYNVPLIDSYEQRHEYDKRSQFCCFINRQANTIAICSTTLLKAKCQRLFGNVVSPRHIDRFKLGVASPPGMDCCVFD